MVARKGCYSFNNLENSSEGVQEKAQWSGAPWIPNNRQTVKSTYGHSNPAEQIIIC